MYIFAHVSVYVYTLIDLVTVFVICSVNYLIKFFFNFYNTNNIYLYKFVVNWIQDLGASYIYRLFCNYFLRLDNG